MTVQTMAATPMDAPIATKMTIVFRVMFPLGGLLSSSVAGAVCDGVVEEEVPDVVALLLGRLKIDDEEEVVGEVDGVTVGEEDEVVEDDEDVEVPVVVADVELAAVEAVLLDVAEGDDEVDLGSPNIPDTIEARPPC